MYHDILISCKAELLCRNIGIKGQNLHSFFRLGHNSPIKKKVEKVSPIDTYYQYYLY